MGVASAVFRERDVYIDYPIEEVMFRYDRTLKQGFRKFYGETVECAIEHSNRLYNDAIVFGEEITPAQYRAGKPIMRIIKTTRSAIEAERGRIPMTFHGEAFLPGHGSADFVVNSNEAITFQNPGHEQELGDVSREGLFQELLDAAQARGLKIVIE